MRFRLRTLLILLAVGPPVLAVLRSLPSISFVVISWIALSAFTIYVWGRAEIETAVGLVFGRVAILLAFIMAAAIIWGFFFPAM
jgi:hypothetical protein